MAPAAPRPATPLKDETRPQATASLQDMETTVWPGYAHQPQGSGAGHLPLPARADWGGKPKKSMLLVLLVVAGVAVLALGGFLVAKAASHSGGNPGQNGAGGGQGSAQEVPASTSRPGASSSQGGAVPIVPVPPGANSTDSTTSTAPESSTTSSTTPGPSSTTAPTAGTGANNTTNSTNATNATTVCYNFYADLTVNPLKQVYTSNPDSAAKGYAECKLCTDGAMKCTSLVYNGKSDLIAAHIHLANGDGNTDGQNGEGPPIVNFCGRNDNGLIDDGTPYTKECQQWDTHGAASNRDVPGAFVTKLSMGMDAATRVQDMAKRPHMYYFNFHTIASWNHWFPVPHGICRGALQLRGPDRW